MATIKPRFSVTFSDDSFEKIKEYQKKHHISTQSKAVASLVEIAINEIESDNSVKKSPDTAEAAPGEDALEADSLRSTLLHNFDRLNREGREKLVDTSDDMVSSGKYIKSCPAGLGTAKRA